MVRTKKIDVENFLAQKKLAVVGVSRQKNKMGNAIFRELKHRGYEVFPINAHTNRIEGVECYPDLKSLPEPVGGIVVVVSPRQTGQVVKDAAAAGITRVWLQLGARSDEAVKFCQDNHITVVYNECIMMFAEPVGSIHKFHRFIWKIFGKLPR